MALWQFKVTCLPERWIDAGGNPESLFGDDGYDTSPTWTDGDVTLLASEMGTILPQGSSWGPALKIWGAEETDDIQLLHENGKVLDLSIRFDLRHPNMALFKSTVAAAERLKMVILDVEHKRVVARDARSLLQAASKSSAARFVKEPISFLLEGSQGGKAT